MESEDEVYGERSNEPEMSKHHGGRQNHGRRVGSVGTHKVSGNMSTSWLEKSVFLKA